MSRRATWVLALAAGCIPPSAPKSRADLETEPFGVIVVSGKGALDEVPAELTVVFTRPMHPIESAADAAAVAGLERATDHHAFPGSWTWFGSRTAVFRPGGGPLPHATPFVLTIPESTQALDGSRLGAPETVAFSTPPPRLTSASYFSEEADTTRRTGVTLEFNMPVTASEVKRGVHLEGMRRGRPVQPTFTLEVGKDADPAPRFSALVDPSTASIEDLVAVAAIGLHSPEGPLGSTEESRIAVDNSGPLKVTVECTRVGEACDPEQSIGLSLSKPARVDDLLSHLETRPRTKLDREQLGDDVSFIDLRSMFAIAPRSKYALTLRAGLVLEDGEKLDEDRLVDVQIGDRAPQLRWTTLASEAVVEAARSLLAFGVSSVNVPSFELSCAPLDAQALITFLSRRPEGVEWIRRLPGGSAREIRPRNTLNATVVSQLGVPASRRSKSGFGVFALGVGSSELSDGAHIVSVTDLGVTTKWGPFGGLAWVTRLSSGAPVEGASVSVTKLDAPNGSVAAGATFAGTTDPNGVVELPRELASSMGTTSAVLIARSGEDWTYSRLLPANEVQPLGMVFSDRRVYRPGETVHVKGYVRTIGQLGGLESPVGRPADVELIDDQGRSVHVDRVVLDAFGAFAVAIDLPRSMYGRATVRARLVPSGAQQSEGAWLDGGGFVVEDYRSVEFKVDAKTDRPTYSRGDVAKVSVTANYLFGAPMHDLPADVTVTRAPTHFVPRGFESFSFGDDLFADRTKRETRSDRAPLGANGRAEAKIKLDLPNQRGAELVDFEASVADVGQAFAVAGRAKSVLVHPGDFYLGLRLRNDPPIFAGDRVRVETVTVDPAGASVRSVPVHLTFFRSAPEGGTYTEIAACDLKSNVATTTDTCAFVTDVPGTYAVLGTATDAHAHALYASEARFVPRRSLHPPPPPPPPPPAAEQKGPETFEERCQGWPRDNQARLELEEQDYTPGDSARACIQAPATRALLTVEREGVLRHELRALPLVNNIVSIPVTPDFEPNARVAVQAVTGRLGLVPTREDGSRRPRASEASYEISVKRDNGLFLSMTPRPVPPRDTREPFHPGDDVDVEVRVLDARGAPARAQVTLFAVDEGVNLLAPYRLPDPAVFWESRGSSVHTTDTRESLYWEPLHSFPVRAPTIREGSTSVGDYHPIGRKDFVPVAVFRPDIVVDADGRATVRFALPHNTTTWKLYAVAANDTIGFGVAEGQIVVSQAFLVRPGLPRFLRVGDRMVGSAVVDTTRDAPADLEVSFSASDSATGQGHVALSLPALGHRAVRFEVQANHPGRSKMRFVLRHGGPTVDDIELQVPVLAPWELETVAFSGQTRGIATERLALENRRPDTGSLEYRVAGTPLVGLSEGFAQLVEYPYGCTEQLVSRLVPLVMLRGLASAYGLSLPADTRLRAGEAIDGILSHQKSSGGFGSWSTSAEASPWLTTYAAWGLSVAKQAGYVVPDAAIDKAFESLDAEKDVEPAAMEDLAFAEDVRASLGRPRAERLRELAGRTALPTEARALLAHALARLDPTSARSLLDAIPLLASGALATVAPEDMRGPFPSSSARATALVLRAFAAIDPKSARVPALTRGLLSLRERGRWASTQDTAWALLALGDVSEQGDAAPRDIVVRLGEEKVGDAHLPGASLGAHAGFLAMPRIAGKSTLSFESTSGSLVYYEAYLRTAPKDPAELPFSHGLQVDKTYRLMSGSGGAASHFHVGDYVRVDIYVTSPAPRDQVVLDDPLPAGFEPVTGMFATEVGAPTLPESRFDHREFRDDRVLTFIDRMPADTLHFAYRARVTTAGAFHTPPARAECMYVPDLFGRTEASVVDVGP